jgi:hypothetical protein
MDSVKDTEQPAAGPVQVLVLQPCPFCGAPVRFDDIEAHLRGVGYRIECEPCYLSMWAFKFEKPDSLAKRWNESRLTELVKRVRAESHKGSCCQRQAGLCDTVRWLSNLGL